MIKRVTLWLNLSPEQISMVLATFAASLTAAIILTLVLRHRNKRGEANG